MKYPCILQIDVTDCAAACLSTICKYYGKKISISTIRRYAGTDKNGTNGVGLIRASNRLGFDAKGFVSETLEFPLNEMQFPCIANVVMRGYNHYVVVYKHDGNTVLIADPAEGIREYEADTFKSFWSVNLTSTLLV